MVVSAVALYGVRVIRIGRVLRAVRHEDDGVQLYAVAHRDHHVATRILEAVVRRLKIVRRFARIIRVFLRRLR